MRSVTGKILFVDLTTKTTTSIDVPDEVYENLLSGVGLGAWVLSQAIPVGADPLGPENVIGFVSGLLTGSGSLITGRWMVVTLSPLTGGWGDSNCGGNFSPAIKQAGYDGIFFRGKAQSPVYLYADDDGAQILDAGEFWGVDAVESEIRLQEKHAGKKPPAVAVIGPAGEAQSLISGIVNDRGRIAARSGVGAVMGSKNLKAVVLGGTRKIGAADPAAVREITKEYGAKVGKANLPGMITGGMLPMAGRALGAMNKTVAIDGVLTVGVFKKWGTIFNNTTGVTSGDSPMKNWSGSRKDFNRSYFKNINPDHIIAREEKKYRCYSCVIGCGGVCSIGDLNGGEFSHTHKPEYETVMAFSGLVMSSNLDAVYTINEVLNRAGMDTISAGGAVAFAVDAFEAGVLTAADTDGLELTWGNAEAIVALVRKMVVRDGFGAVLADGVKKAAERIGRTSSEYAVEIGGQEPGMHDPRYDPLLGVHFTADPTPARHTIGSSLYYVMTGLWQQVSWAPRVTIHPKAQEYVASDEEALKSVASTCYKQVVDGVGGCLFAAITGVQHWRVFDWINAAMGWNKTADEYMEIGRRMQTMRQQFSVTHGVDPVKTALHRKIATPLATGPTKGRTLPMDDMVRNHWKHFGWDARTGVPGDRALNELGIRDLPSLNPAELGLPTRQE